MTAASTAARELAHLGITSRVVNPCPVDTGWMDADIRTAPAGATTHRAVRPPQDTADLVAFLLSDKGGWVSGQPIESNGGYSV